MQLIEDNGNYYVWTRCGRVGEKGRILKSKSYAKREDAVGNFMKKFMDKTNNDWNHRNNFEAIKGKYTLIEMWNDDEDDDKEPTKSADLRVQTDMSPNHTMVQSKLDTNTFPLGKLSKSQLWKGMAVLKELKHRISNEETSYLCDLSSKFYTLIPRAFGRKKPPIITTEAEVQKEITKLNVLLGIKDTQTLLKSNEPKNQDLVQDYDRLLSAWKSCNCDLACVGKILESLKVELNSFLPSDQSVSSRQEILIVRNILEIGAHWSIEMKNIASFEYYITQLKHNYYDFHNEGLNSENKYELLALNLLRLLAQDRLDEFHSKLELLTPEEKDNTYIKHPICLAQYFIEKRYDKLFESRINVPSPRFTLFMDILLETARKKIASCLEASHEFLPLNEIEKKLFFSDKEDLKTFALERKWTCDSDVWHINKEFKDNNEKFPYREVTNTMPEYATE